jgi:hypothetical protein
MKVGSDDLVPAVCEILWRSEHQSEINPSAAMPPSLGDIITLKTERNLVLWPRAVSIDPFLLIYPIRVDH